MISLCKFSIGKEIRISIIIADNVTRIRKLPVKNKSTANISENYCRPTKEHFFSISVTFRIALNYRSAEVNVKENKTFCPRGKIVMKFGAERLAVIDGAPLTKVTGKKTNFSFQNCSVSLRRCQVTAYETVNNFPTSFRYNIIR